jgi:hypothetical protein
MKKVVPALILAVALLLARFAPAQDSSLQNPLPGKKANAAFEDSDGCTTLQVTANDGTSMLHQQLPKQALINAAWTNDGDYLVMAGRNCEGHSPWRYIVTVFSVADREVRMIDDSNGQPPCIASLLWMQGPNGVVYVGHSFRQKIEAPNDPIIVKHILSQAWPKLKKVTSTGGQ